MRSFYDSWSFGSLLFWTIQVCVNTVFPEWTSQKIYLITWPNCIMQKRSRLWTPPYSKAESYMRPSVQQLRLDPNYVRQWQQKINKRRTDKEKKVKVLQFPSETPFLNPIDMLLEVLYTNKCPQTSINISNAVKRKSGSKFLHCVVRNW